MKKRNTAILSFVLTGILTLQVYANSAPIRMYGNPSSALMSIEERSPIEVVKEELSFDLSEGSWNRAEVTASYLMRNTEGDKVASKMVFPYIGKFLEFSEGPAVISVDGQEIPYTLYFGNTLQGDTMEEQEADAETFEIGEALASLNAGEYQPKNFDKDASGTTHRIRVEREVQDGRNLALKFQMDEGKTKVIAHGFNGYSRNGNQVELTRHMDEETVVEIHVLGEEVEVAVEGFMKDGVRTEKSDDFDYDHTIEKERLGDYLARHQDYRYTEKNLPFTGSGLESLYLKALDEGFEPMQGVATEDVLNEAEFEDRYLFLVYEVPFLPGEEKTVAVSYTAEATVDRSVTTVPTYTFTYLLSPAAYWKDFRKLEVEVKTSEFAPYLIGSSMEMQKTADRTYRADLDGLPDGELTFTLYHKPEITAQDRIQGKLQNTFGYLYPVVVTTLFLLLGMVIIIVVLNRYRRKRQAGN